MSHASHTNPKDASGPARNAFTVDLEDWYQGIELPLQRWLTCAPRLEIGLTRVLDLLEKYQVTATFFVLGWIAERHPLLIKEVARRGHEIGSHGNSHDKVYHLEPEAFRRDIRITRDLIRAGRLLRIELLDHVILGRASPDRSRDYVSLREMGYFAK